MFMFFYIGFDTHMSQMSLVEGAVPDYPFIHDGGIYCYSSSAVSQYI